MLAREILERIESAVVESVVELPVKITADKDDRETFLNKLSTKLKEKCIAQVTLINWSRDFFESDSKNNLNELFSFLLRAGIKKINVNFDCKVEKDEVSSVREIANQYKELQVVIKRFNTRVRKKLIH